MTIHPLETYLHELRDSHAAGVAETSYYGILASLLNEAGKSLKPKVKCIIHPRSKGAGIPDGGLFTPDQLPKHLSGVEDLSGLIPARGAMEVKGTAANVDHIAASAQVAKYLDTYGQVLITNYRDFVLVIREHGKVKKLEAYHLAESEAAFWTAAAHAHKTAEVHGERFIEYLKRVMLHAAQLSAPADVALFIASYAREARARIEQNELPALATIRTALEQSLGLSFEVEDVGGKAKADHFFRSTLVQTLFYGVFSAWVLWHTEDPARIDEFHWQMAGQYLHLPVLQAIFWEFTKPADLKSHGLTEVLDWTGEVLNRVDRAAFFARFEESYAVQYFYEPFLQAFDPELRKDLGVVYTPIEVVQYQVARVDAVLREELGIEDGLADPRVVVLDPCAGTGPYVREVLSCIARTLTDKHGEALMGEELKRAAMERVFAFEILSAPFVIAHLQISLLLQRYGAAFDDNKGERAAIYLTNSLTGWEPIKTPKSQLPIVELQQERDAASKIKREAKILVVMGNPPYNAFAGVAMGEESDLIDRYKQGLITEWGIKKFNLDDLYVRFFALAERRIVEMTGQGVVCFISNHSWISDPSFVVMRQHLLKSFDRFWIENMHGNRKISEYAPDGRTSETVFAMHGFSPGIQQGVAISLWVKSGKAHHDGQVLFRDDIDAAKADERRKQLLATLKTKKFNAAYEVASPNKANRFSFRPSAASVDYLAWPKVVDLCADGLSNGLMEKRAGALIDIDRAALEKRMQMYFDPKVDWSTLQSLGTGLTEDAAGYEAKKVRPKIISAAQYQASRVLRYALRPFETRWCYYSEVNPLWNRARPSLWAQYWNGNRYLMTRPSGVASPEGVPFYLTSMLGDNDFLRGHAYYFPLRLQASPSNSDSSGQIELFASTKETTANLSPSARAYLTSLGIKNPDADVATAELIWLHALAIGYAPAYLAENADGIRGDWPRIPLPNSKAALLASAELGRHIAALLDTEHTVSGVTSGTLQSELKAIGVLTRAGGGQLKLPDDLKVTAGWGHPGQNGVTMPGKGKIQASPPNPLSRSHTADFERGGADISPLQTTAESSSGKGPGVRHDVYLNDTAYWANIPERVWDYIIGGYQVIKKWLSYREFTLLGCALTIDEAREVTNMARRIAAIIALELALDANYRAVIGDAYAWPQLTA